MTYVHTYLFIFINVCADEKTLDISDIYVFSRYYFYDDDGDDVGGCSLEKAPGKYHNSTNSSNLR